MFKKTKASKFLLTLMVSIFLTPTTTLTQSVTPILVMKQRKIISQMALMSTQNHYVSFYTDSSGNVASGNINYSFNGVIHLPGIYNFAWIEYNLLVENDKVYSVVTVEHYTSQTTQDQWGIWGDTNNQTGEWITGL